MLKNIHPLLAPDLLHALAAMGHGDEIGIVDANFPAASLASRLVELRGASSPDVLDAILTLFPLDSGSEPAAHTMQVISHAAVVPEPVMDFAAAFTRHALLRAWSSPPCVRKRGSARAAGTSNCATRRGGGRLPAHRAISHTLTASSIAWPTESIQHRNLRISLNLCGKVLHAQKRQKVKQNRDFLSAENFSQITLDSVFSCVKLSAWSTTSTQQ